MIEACSWLVWAAAEAPSGGRSPFVGPQFQQMILLFAMIGVAFWLIILRPQKKEQGKRQSMLDNLKKGDRIVTIGGIHGWVSDIDKGGKTISIRVDGKTNLKINRSAVSTMESREGEERESDNDLKSQK